METVTLDQKIDYIKKYIDINVDKLKENKIAKANDIEVVYYSLRKFKTVLGKEEVR